MRWWQGLAVAACIIIAAGSVWVPISDVNPPRSILNGLEAYADFETLDNLKILRQSTSNAHSDDGYLEHIDYFYGRPSHFRLKPQPLFDVRQTKAGFMLYAATPGLRKEDLSIEIVEGPGGNVLDITGGSRHNISSADTRISNQRDHDGGHTTELENHLPLRPPRWVQEYAEFERVTPIPNQFNISSLQAKYQNGLLIVTIDPSASGNKNLQCDDQPHVG